MNESEHLLTCLAEECAEIQQAVTKALRFGLDDSRPGATTSMTNAEEIAAEITDLMAVVDMCRDKRLFAQPQNAFDLYGAKKAKVTRYMGYAIERGSLVKS